MTSKIQNTDGKELPEIAIPQGTCIPEHQVAGHVWGNKKSRIGFLKDEDGSLLKAIQSPPRGERELQFYQKLFAYDCRDPVMLKFKTFVPKYLGVIYKPPNVKFMKMEDVTEMFKRPCVADLKMGQQTWDPEASPEKRTREDKKYLHVKETGLQLIGMRVLNQKDSFDSWDKVYGRNLSVEELKGDKGLGLYLSAAPDLYKVRIINGFIDKLRIIEGWFEIQTDYNFFACSILLVYEGKHAKGSGIVCNGHSKVEKNGTHMVTHGSVENGTEHLNIPNGIAINMNGIEGTNIPNGIAMNELHPNKSLLLSNYNTNALLKSGQSFMKDEITNHHHQTSLKSSQHHKHEATGGGTTNGLIDSPISYHLSQCNGASVCNEDKTQPLCDVRLIDHTHVFTLNKRDDNFLYGLRQLMKYLAEMRDAVVIE